MVLGTDAEHQSRRMGSWQIRRGFLRQSAAARGSSRMPLSPASIIECCAKHPPALLAIRSMRAISHRHSDTTEYAQSCRRASSRIGRSGDAYLISPFMQRRVTCKSPATHYGIAVMRAIQRQ